MAHPSAMARSAESTAREARRARSTPKLVPRFRADGECSTGHPAVFAATPAFELGRIPEGGGYPDGFVELACRLMDCPSPTLAVHLCSGSVKAPLTVDIRPEVRPAVVADVRWLPFGRGQVRWILTDPPYGEDYAEALWGKAVAKRYPTPAVLLRECAEVLRPGGMVGLLHHVVPSLPPTLERIGVWGVTTGPGYRIRALTIARKTTPERSLFDG